MHMCSYIALVAQVSPCVSFHVIHACALVSCLLSGLSSPVSLYFFLQFLFQLYLMSIPAPDEISIEDPLCNSSLGSMATLDYVTLLTSSTTSCSLSSTTRSSWQVCATPLQMRVRTPWTPPTLSHLKRISV